MILLSGYVWENSGLCYKAETLKSFGLMKMTEAADAQYLVLYKVHWAAISRSDLLRSSSDGEINGHNVTRCSESAYLGALHESVTSELFNYHVRVVRVQRLEGVERLHRGLGGASRQQILSMLGHVAAAEGVRELERLLDGQGCEMLVTLRHTGRELRQPLHDIGLRNTVVRDLSVDRHVLLEREAAAQHLHERRLARSGLTQQKGDSPGLEDAAGVLEDDLLGRVVLGVDLGSRLLDTVVERGQLGLRVRVSGGEDLGGDGEVLEAHLHLRHGFAHGGLHLVGHVAVQRSEADHRNRVILVETGPARSTPIELFQSPDAIASRAGQVLLFWTHGRLQPASDFATRHTIEQAVQDTLHALSLSAPVLTCL
ncbi:hypothetical protein ON010_g94 [Phytophthora cinnamomi]|nr:hypothetical protein ON010_g94 [Phytophthora cinnamomi]